MQEQMRLMFWGNHVSHINASGPYRYKKVRVKNYNIYHSEPHAYKFELIEKHQTEEVCNEQGVDRIMSILFDEPPDGVRNLVIIHTQNS